MNISHIFLATILMNTFAYLTIRLRPYLFKVKLFRPMLWNFKLSLLPFLIQIVSIATVLIGSIVASYSGWHWIYIFGFIVFGVLQVVWLLFLPNSAYLITELNLTHRDMDASEVPMWYDIVSILSFALSGILNTCLNIIMIQFEIIIFIDPVAYNHIFKRYMLLGTCVITFLVSIGIYLGRNIRFNTWDLVHPVSLIKKFGAHLSKEREAFNFLLFISLHTLFFLLMFLSFGMFTL